MPKASSAEVEKPKAPKSGRKFGGGKKTSLYNQYMKKQLTPYKEANPDASHQDAFKAVAQMWADADENPNKGKDPKAKKAKKTTD